MIRKRKDRFSVHLMDGLFRIHVQGAAVSGLCDGLVDCRRVDAWIFYTYTLRKVFGWDGMGCDGQVMSEVVIYSLIYLIARQEKGVPWYNSSSSS